MKHILKIGFIITLLLYIFHSVIVQPGPQVLSINEYKQRIFILFVIFIVIHAVLILAVIVAKERNLLRNYRFFGLIFGLLWLFDVPDRIDFMFKRRMLEECRSICMNSYAHLENKNGDFTMGCTKGMVVKDSSAVYFAYLCTRHSGEHPIDVERVFYKVSDEDIELFRASHPRKAIIYLWGGWVLCPWEGTW